MKNVKYTKWQLFSLVLLRVFIGWHFLYEGVIKLYNPSWTAKSYLLTSQGFIKSFYVWMAGDSFISVVDTIMVAGLLVVGVGVMAGIMTRWVAVAGSIILLLLYLAHPALLGLSSGLSAGNYWLINNNLIEIAALMVIYQFPVSYYFSLEFIFKKEKSTEQTV